jgi:hypothetical protein
MKTVDYSGMIVMYNFVIGVLIMLASDKIAAVPGYLRFAGREKLMRWTLVSTRAFGGCVAALSGSIYVAFHWLRLGLRSAAKLRQKKGCRGIPSLLS